MATTYAAYYNLTMANKAARLSESRRASANSDNANTVEPTPKKSGFKKVLSQFRATEDEITPSGIYSPIIKQGPLFNGLKPAEKEQNPTPMYQRERPLFGSFSNKKRGSQGSISSQGSN